MSKSDKRSAEKISEVTNTLAEIKEVMPTATSGVSFCASYEEKLRIQRAEKILGKKL